MDKIRLAIIGTGPAGRAAIEHQKWLDINGLQYSEITCIAASKRTAGRHVGEVLFEKEVSLSRNLNFWQQKPVESYPEYLLNMALDEADPDIIAEKADYAISAVGSEVAKVLEPELTKRGVNVFSNASAFRWHPDVPLLIPEVNYKDIHWIERQETPGKLVCNPNCTTAGFVPLIHALETLGYEIASVQLTTQQATSGKGDAIANPDYAARIIGNVIDDWTDESGYNAEEWKSAAEPQKILGRCTNKNEVTEQMKRVVRGEDACILPIYTQTSRVPVQYGHLEGIAVEFTHKVSADEIEHGLAGYQVDQEVASLPTTPADLFIVTQSMPSPKQAYDFCMGMPVFVGDLKQHTPSRVSLWTLTDNLKRGATWAGRQGLELYLREYKGMFRE